MALGFSTRAIEVGQAPDPATAAVIPPIYLTSTFAQERVGDLKAGYEYSRSGNPSRDSLQEALASLESAKYAYSYASGLAAEDNLLRSVLLPGDTIVLGNDAYGGTHRLIDKVYSKWGITNVVVDFGNLDTAAATINSVRPKAIWLETPSNPLLAVSDIAKLAEIAHTAGALLIVDNTFATPVLQRPIELGADIVLHSTTKYIGGHSDIVGGAVITNNADIAEQLAFNQNSLGAVSSPFDAWLTRRSIKTLAVRVERHSQNALTIAQKLEGHPALECVLYPGLESHAGHEVAKAQMSAFGGMISVIVKGGEQQALALAEHTKVFTLAESLGGVESLIEYPYAMTHGAVTGTALEVPKTLIRLSVGIEDVADQIDDLLSALEHVK